MQHEGRAKAACAGDAVAGTAAVEVDFVVAIAGGYSRRRAELRRVRTAKLKDERALLGREPKEAIRLRAVDERRVDDHLCPEPGAAAEEARELAEVDVSPVHPAPLTRAFEARCGALGCGGRLDGVYLAAAAAAAARTAASA